MGSVLECLKPILQAGTQIKKLSVMDSRKNPEACQLRWSPRASRFFQENITTPSEGSPKWMAQYISI